MEKYEHEKWREEIRECFLGNSETAKGITNWEGIITNLGVFFMQHGRQDITKLLLEFVCQNGEFSQLAAFNLASIYLSLAREIVECGFTKQSPPIDLSTVKEGSLHPDFIVNKLGMWKDMLEETWK